MGCMPESAARSAVRKAAVREAGRRRRAVTMLEIGEATCRYAASQLANGASPAEARRAALFVAGELEIMADALRALTRLGPGERRRIARSLSALGWSRREIADRLGVSQRTVYGYLHRGNGR